MERYMTVAEAAERWDVSVRLVQQYCLSGRIEGAAKFGGAWAIPQKAEKPTDPRRIKRRPNVKSNVSEEMGSSEFIPMPLLNAPFCPGRCMEYVEKIADARERDIALAEYYYFSGRPEKSSELSELYLSHSEPMLRLSACWIYAYSNLSLGQIQRVRYAMSEIKRTVDSAKEGASAEVMATAAFVSTGASVLLHLPINNSGYDEFSDCIRMLPPGLKMFALYIQAHRTYLDGEYGKSIGIIETAFAMQSEIHPIASIYMHLVAVMDYMSLKQIERAKEHLQAAWELAEPDDLIEAFGEHHGLLGGMLEAYLKKDHPEDFKRIIAITYRFSAGWRKVHNPDTGHDVADNLTTTEFAASMLAARGWTNREIAEHMGISPNTVKQHISTTLQKLGISQRRDLKRFMLR